MTIASEITRLQWAKADIKTSIENKWVTVPSSAKLDDYSSYVDQIVQWWTWMSGIQLRSVFQNQSQATLRWGGLMSRIENDVPYGCALFAQNRTSSTVIYSLYTVRKAWANVDLTYNLNDSTSFGTAHYWTGIENPSYWKNGTTAKVFFFTNTDYSTWWVKLFQCTWNYTTGSWATVSQIASGTTTNLNDYNVDLDGYTQITNNEWVASATSTQTGNDNYIYLTLK